MRSDFLLDKCKQDFKFKKPMHGIKSSNVKKLVFEH